ncbi:hypothetical protein [Heyndrickxia coagulans]|uniref:Uncharacterized protein n=1 Tax=Heyndrickxia coagulans TaxID=1398 RepID=A0AAW7CF55_HEYCO|nr:hypothetical protein [Heyndrickxia coagulans]MDL5039506.1 hypothetical protein [Heyndrickxia coagulans]
MTMKCVYNETLISLQHETHNRQFGETYDGDRLAIFADNRAVVFVDLNGRYRVESLDGEVVFIGTGGIDEALARIDYAQPLVDVQIIEGDRTYTRDDYYRHIAPVVYLIAQHFDDDTGSLAIAYERRKNGRLLDDGTVIVADDGAFGDWLAEQVEKEERPPVMRFGDWLPVSVQSRLAELDINDEYPVEIKRGTWPALRKKAKEDKQ